MRIKTIADLAATHGSSELERIGYLDGWRGLAIAFVLQHHFFEVKWANFGILGVNVFFCLSGLLMSRILFVKGLL
jgi:peptidoglycan/LPS O-acetylase OafA/YrhL